MIYLGLGSNQGDRRGFIRTAMEQLEAGGFAISETSPVVESPPLLTPGAPADWNRPFMNLVVSGRTRLAPLELLELAKRIEQQLGRDLDAPRWSPRPVDIDILVWNSERIALPGLTVPHPEMHKRSFVITPLMHLAPDLELPGMNISPLQISRQIRPIPLWMGIVNLTPDSFSDGGVFDSKERLQETLSEWIDAGVHILDVGGESTRPGGGSVAVEEEWARLAPVFELLNRLEDRHPLMPLISVDTRHPEVASRALQAGADWINDVTGLDNPRMLELLAGARGGVAMHSLSVPVRPGQTLPQEPPVVKQLETWLVQRREKWLEHGVDMGKLIFDPGVGFGKSPLQNMEIIKASGRLRQLGFRLLIGHSRKSFMNSFTRHDFGQRDMETLGLSLAMCEQGVDILRVHDPVSHLRAYRAWSHARALI